MRKILNIAIVEDDIAHAINLQELLIIWASSKHHINISFFNEGEKLLKSLKNKAIYDIIFFDIRLGDADGIYVAKKTRELGYDKTIVFTTNYSDRALDGYEVNAYRYYIKPVQIRDIKECMGYVLNLAAGECFQYSYYGEIVRIPWKNVICFESTKHYIDIYTTNKTFNIKHSLKAIQQQCPSFFIRCQRSYIVNKNFIKKKTGNKLLLFNNKVIDIAPRCSKVIRKALEDNLHLIDGKNNDL